MLEARKPPLFVWIFLISWITLGFSQKVYKSDGEDILNFYNERRLQQAGFEDYTVTQLWEKTGSSSRLPFVSETVHRRRRSLEETKKSINIEFQAFNETFTLKLQHTESVVHPDAKVVLTNGDEETIWTGPHPDCFLTGTVTSHDTGTASMAYCDDMMGGMWTVAHEYHLETLPVRLHKRDTTSGDVMSVFVSRRRLGASMLDTLHLHDDTLFPKKEDAYERDKRNTYTIPSTTFTIELAVYTDAAFTAIFSYTDVTRRIAAMATKYNGVQTEWGRSTDLGYTVTITIKYLNFMDTDPSWYSVSPTLGSDLSQICQGAATSAHDPYDHVFLHTGVAGANLGGLAYQNNMCKNNYKCAVSASSSLLSYVATAHEIGHNMGMYHDADLGCTSPDVGVMGSYGAGWSTCSKSSMQSFLETGKGQCLWETNIPLANVSTDLQNVTLVGELVGQTLLEDEVCEVLHGSGFHFREYPNFSNCGMFSCVDLNRGTTYGQMYKESSSISGNYCGDGKICFKGSCTTLADAKQTGVTVSAGGWGPWATWTTCTRTCGTGINSRKRVCNNPRPKNHAICTGDEYEADVCNDTPCLGDSTTEATLKASRASESCALLVQNGVISGTNYQTTGTVYNNVRMGKCEVECDAQSGYSPPSYTRYGLMPDGSPCKDTLHSWDANNWPRRPGNTEHCLDGYCQKFGCDKKFNGQEYDQCGVCGGDNSTCLFYNSVYTDAINQGERLTILQLPVGTFNIQFWFTFSTMTYNFIELWSKSDTAIIASNVGSSWVWDTEDNPVSHAGVFWSFVFHSQYLLGQGTLTDAVTIKFYRDTGNANVGVNYAYSTPLNVGSCTGSCQNGGTYDSSICGCICPSGFYNADCSSTCNKQCQNGGTVIESGCTCQCNTNSFGNKCQTCKVPYNGQACQSCVGATCLNCALFDSATCRCKCLDGYGGATCDATCADTGATCVADAAAGKCDTDNVNMEAACPLSCGLCVAKSPPDACSATTTTAATTTTTQAQVTVTTCTASQFTCTNGNCIDNSAKCNSVDDCGDMSDELSPCMSTETTTTVGPTTTSVETTTTTVGPTTTSVETTTTAAGTTTTAGSVVETTTTAAGITTTSAAPAQPTTTVGLTTTAGSLVPTTTTAASASMTTTTGTTTMASTTESDVSSTTDATPGQIETTTVRAVPALTNEEARIIGFTVGGFMCLVLLAAGYGIYINKMNATRSRPILNENGDSKSLNGVTNPYFIPDEGPHELTSRGYRSSRGRQGQYSNRSSSHQSGWKNGSRQDIQPKFYFPNGNMV